ncbi:uncharacterized protein BDR25DRAFT_357215 [Lindgomyces ingoldianus]|uniref:Uncharacterized protein n=1 Tax=Lindgomyces ingoldianus TaxID=673940 RepID=A0ACB6QPK4_9PLEO|nr:uncharacterized protein BDR25DRAFT_357215 [Lindgomyces ingoldianus]KAF2468851.1 hypothetical protein BDR25DRAFT_357215 [Lindgomyces ingoldianus]
MKRNVGLGMSEEDEGGVEEEASLVILTAGKDVALEVDEVGIQDADRRELGRCRRAQVHPTWHSHFLSYLNLHPKTPIYAIIILPIAVKNRLATRTEAQAKRQISDRYEYLCRLQIFSFCRQTKGQLDAPLLALLLSRIANLNEMNPFWVIGSRTLAFLMVQDSLLALSKSRIEPCQPPPQMLRAIREDSHEVAIVGDTVDKGGFGFLGGYTNFDSLSIFCSPHSNPVSSIFFIGEVVACAIFKNLILTHCMQYLFFSSTFHVNWGRDRHPAQSTNWEQT